MDNFEEIPPEKVIDVLSTLDKSIVKITEFIQALQNTKQKLNSKETRTPDEEVRLAKVKEQLEVSLKERDVQFELADRLLTIMQEHMRKIISDQNADATTLNEQLCVLPLYDPATTNTDCHDMSTEDLHKVVMLDVHKTKKNPPHIMVLQSTDNCAGAVCSVNECNSCTVISECEPANDVKSCCCQSSTDVCEKSVESVQKCELSNALMNSEICNLNKYLENIINTNQNLLLKLRNAIQQNDIMDKALKCPAPFKYSVTDGVRFPGKKEMEEKLRALQPIIIQLNHELKEVQINQAKLKLVKEFIKKYNDKIISCKCDSPIFKQNIDTVINVKKQQIQQIKLQLKPLDNELNNIRFDYDCAFKTNQRTVSKINHLNKALMEIKRKIEEYNIEKYDDMMTLLNKTNEKIETMELLIKERGQEIYDCNEKLKQAKLDAKNITRQTEVLEDSVKQLSGEFSDINDNLKFCYKGKLKEMLALPIVLKATFIKLQEETDLRVLAEETKSKLEREIKEAEAEHMKRPIENEDLTEKIAKVERENKEIESNINTLHGNIKLFKAYIDNDTKELDAVNELVQKAVIESDKHINAFKNFSAIHLNKIAGDLNSFRELLTELQSKECEKSSVRDEVMALLKCHVDSTNCNVEKCIEEMRNFMDQTEC